MSPKRFGYLLSFVALAALVLHVHAQPASADRGHRAPHACGLCHAPAADPGETGALPAFEAVGILPVSFSRFHSVQGDPLFLNAPRPPPRAARRFDSAVPDACASAL
jgi:hypothetical protein